jgi:hypothetical protein
MELRERVRKKEISLISNFRHVLNVACMLLGNSDAGELPRRKHTTRKIFPPLDVELRFLGR